MQEQIFLTTKDQLGYAEEYIILQGRNELLNYSLSNSIEDIKIAIFSRTGQSIDLDNAYWKINSKLSINVKHLMNKHHVNYSMTILEKSRNRSIYVNMRANDKWFITGFDEINGSFYSWNYLHTCNTLRNIIEYIFPDETDDESDIEE
jgi:hypothetical protein